MRTEEMPLKIIRKKDAPYIVMRRQSLKKAVENAEKFLRRYGEFVIASDTVAEMSKILQVAELVESRFRGERRDVVYTVTSYPFQNRIRHEMHGYLQDAMIHELLD